MYPTTKNIVNSDTFVILYYNPQMAEDGELMSLHADSSCQLLGGKVENPSMPSTLFFLFVCLFWNHTLFLYPLLLIRLTSHFSRGMLFFTRFGIDSLCDSRLLFTKMLAMLCGCFPLLRFCLDLEVCHHLTICSSYFGFED